MNGLPPEAAVWRRVSFTPEAELTAIVAERQEEWSRALFYAVRGKKVIQLPAPLTILRPGQEHQERRIETDPHKIADFFRTHIAGGG